MEDKYQGVKIQKIAKRGGPLGYKTFKWKPVLNASNEDLKALSKTIKASEKKVKEDGLR